MKKIFTLCVFVSIILSANSQAVLNEVYPQPGNGYNEFFELYNENNTLEHLDNYTIVSYYQESGGKSGFYILDMPDDSMPAHGFYAGASENPFNIQQQLGLIADFSWNAMPAGGDLTKWEKSGTTYIQVSVPVNLNDFFNRVVGGNGGVYHVFVFKNGMLVNGIVGGINASSVPAYIKSMPALFVNMSGSSPDFTIDFNTLSDNRIEFIPNSLGTNNGYYRNIDGLCGEWLKSDQPGQHNPRQSNGNSGGNGTSNQYAIAASISPVNGDPNSSLLTYNLSSIPLDAYPVQVQAYLDLGIHGELDINDSLADIRTLISSADGTQNIILPGYEISVIIVATSVSNCYNKNVWVESYLSVLPISLMNFQGNINKENKVTLNWAVADNENVYSFEVERSSDGRNFNTVGLVFGSEKTGNEQYSFFETLNSSGKVMYRLKMKDKNNDTEYSKILSFDVNKGIDANKIRILGNPVTDKLTFSFTASTSRILKLRVYDISGRTVMSHDMNSNEGLNMFSIPLNAAITPGIYVMEVSNGIDKQTAKFVKQ